MATPRSLRSFFDSTPPDLLDTALPSLLLLSRANYEQTQAEVTSLRSQLAEKEEALSSLFIQQHSSGGGGGNTDGTSDAQLGASIERGVHEVQLESLQRKNEDLNEQNRKLALALETSEAKSRALAEVKNMRDRWQGPAATAAREEQEKRYAALESQLRATTSELEVRKAENDRLMLERTTRVRALESGGGPTTPQRKEHSSEDMELLRSENEKLLLRLKSFETGNASLNKTVSVLKTVVKTNEQSNVDLQKKNLDLVAGINMLESQYERTQKKNIILESKNSELEDDKRALEVKLKQLGDNRHFIDTDTQQLEGRNKQLEDDNKILEVRINQLVDSKKKLETTNSQLQDRNKYLTDTNIKLLDAKKAAELKQQQLQDDKVRLNNEIADSRTKLLRLEKSGAAVTTQRQDLESSKKKLAEENLYLVRKNERQTQKIKDLGNEVTTLEERSKRMLSEIHTLRQDKNRLNDDLNDLVRQQRNERRASIDREREQRSDFSPHTKANGVSPSTSTKPHESPASPAMATRGTKRNAEDRDDTAQTPVTNTPRSNYTIRAIAETPTQQTSVNTQPPSPPQRSLFDRVKQPALSAPECRSLFERINAPSPPSRPQIDREVDELITISGDAKRGVFCRFHGFQPKVAELLELISGGPLESVRMALEKDVAFLWFLRPRDAAAFMSYARAHLNGGKMTLPHPGGKASTPVEFTWNEKPVRALDRDIATNVVRYGASRTFVIHCVPYDISLQKIASDFGGKRFGFWLCEGVGGKVARDGRTQGREVVVEFANVRDAIDARKKLGQDFWCEASWAKEGCDRAIAGSMPAPAGGNGGAVGSVGVAGGATGAAGTGGAGGAAGTTGQSGVAR